MTDSTITLIVGLAGIAGTLLSSLIGHYYTAKARKTAYQNQLFTEQLSMLKKIHLALGHLKSVVPLLTDENTPSFKKAEEDARLYIKELIELTHEASAILPSELWVYINRLVDDICNFLGKPTENRTRDDIRKIASATGVISIASRRLLGVDELTKETTNLITNTTEDQLVSNEGHEELEKIAKEKLKD